QRVIAAGFRSLRAFSAEDYRRLGAERLAFWSGLRVLLDAGRPGAGETFDPALLDDARPHGRGLLGGGLDRADVGGRVGRARPGGVDVSSGVEAERGVKSAAPSRESIAAARAA